MKHSKIEHVVVDGVNQRPFVVLTDRSLTDGEISRYIGREVLRRGSQPIGGGEFRQVRVASQSARFFGLCASLKASLAILAGALMLLIGSGRVFSAETPVSAELNGIIRRIQSNIEQGRKTKADLAPNLKEFEDLLEKYSGQQTDDVAEILATEARLYLQVLDDSAQARQLIMRLQRDFPHTTQARKAPELLATISRREEAQRLRNLLVIGSSFPEFSEKDTLRNQVTLSRYRGRVVLLQFWATWSKSSTAEVPQLVAVYDHYSRGGFEIIGISLDDDQLRLSAFTTREKIRWPQICEGSARSNKLALKYGVNTLPVNYLLDREGNIIGKNLHGAELEEKLATALARK